MTRGTNHNKRDITSRQIHHMLDERKDLLALMLHVSRMTQRGRDKPDAELLEEFCELLVDYIATGHFGLYQRIADGRERRNRAAALASNIYPEIERTTQIALDFSEKYKIDGTHDRPDRLQNDLSELGVALTTRIELEDQLIAAVLDTNTGGKVH